VNSVQHIDLFAGIGGFSLASDTVWDNVQHTFIELDPFCQAIIKKHWPTSKIHGDIRQ
jgi:DNA (cytosine-5)-methyltransferase 1